MTAVREEHDWKAATFVLSVDDVARMLDAPVRTVVSLILSGQLGFWVAPSPDRVGLPLSAVRFDPADVTAFRESSRTISTGVAAAVLDNLRNFVGERGITQDYDAALRDNRALRTRAGVHVRLKAVVAYAIATEAAPAAQLEGSTRQVFEELGMPRRRSLTPIGSKTQRWNYWWRVPQVLLAKGPDVALTDLLGQSAGLVAGEQVVAAPDGTGPVVDVPVTAGELNWDVPEPAGE